MSSATAEGTEGGLAIAVGGEGLGRSRTPWRLWLVSAATAIAAHGAVLVLPMATPEETIQLPPPAPKAAIVPLTAVPTPPTPKPRQSPQKNAPAAPARSRQTRPPAASSTRSAATPTVSPRVQRPTPAVSPSPEATPAEDSQKPDPKPSASPSPESTNVTNSTEPTNPTEPTEPGLDLTQNPPEPAPEPEPEPEPDPLGLPSLPGLPVSEGGCGTGTSCYGLPDNFGVHSITAQRLQDALGDQVTVRENSDLYDRTEQAREFILSHADSTEEIGYYYVISTPIAGQVGAVMLGSRDRLSTLEEIRQMALGQPSTGNES